MILGFLKEGLETSNWILIGMLSWWVANGIDTASADRLTICHVSSRGLGKILPRAKDAFLEHSGFRLAIEDFNQKNTKKVEFRIQTPSGNDIDVIEGIRLAARTGCSVIVGLVSTRDALLAGPDLTANQLVGISSTATANAMDQFFPYLLSFAPSQKQQLSSISRDVQKNRMDSKVFLINKPDDIYSLSFTREAKRVFPNAQVVRVDSKNLISRSDLDAIHASHRSVLLYALYPMSSTPSLYQIAESLTLLQKQETILFGPTPWLETQVFAMNSAIFSRLPEIKVFTPWKYPLMRSYSLKRRQFLRAYQSRFGCSPDYDSIYNFDVTSFILHCYAQQPVGFSRAQFNKCLSGKTLYRGIIGPYAFTGRNAHPIHQLFKTQYIPSSQILPLRSE